MMQYFKNFEIKSLETNSNVSETPIGDEEGIKGCLHRIKDAISQNEMVTCILQWREYYQNNIW